MRLLAWIRSALWPASAPTVSMPPVARPDPRPNSDSEFTAPGKRTITVDGFRIELDLATQVLAMQAPIDREFDWESETDAPEAPVSATLPSLDSRGLVSASVLAQKAKVFDDGLYAAIEIAAQEGAGRHQGKVGLLTSIGRTLSRIENPDASEVQRMILGALALSRVTMPDVPRAVSRQVTRAVEEFIGDERKSKPIGFYTWSTHLTRIFQQDRMLQEKITDPRGVRILADALDSDARARAIYEHHLRLVSRLTNPFANSDLRGPLEGRDPGAVSEDATDIRFLPPSIAHETELGKKLYGDRPIPEGFVLVDEMIRRIGSGELDLEPSPESGWYDYQSWALEPLVIPDRMPEAQRLEFDDGYRSYLLDLFKGLLALTRETHVKQLEQVEFGAMRGPGRVNIRIAPALTAEPLVTFYLRRALGYRFVREVLDEAFGPAALQQLRRLTPDGPVASSLAEELADIEALFLGAYASVSRELGLSPTASAGSEASADDAANRFEEWARDWRKDSDLRSDMRAMVPIFYDLGRRKTKVWAFLGWSSRPLTVSFARPPRVTMYDLGGVAMGSSPFISWGELHAELPYPVTAELYVDRILDRREFQRLCDRCSTQSEILERLGSDIGAR